MTQYIFTLIGTIEETQTFLSGLSNFQDVGFTSGKIAIANFNHTTQQQKDDFCNTLAKAGITSVKIDGVETNLFEKYDYLMADQHLFTTELSITKTNIGTSFVDIYNDFGGRNFFVDLMSYTKIRYFVNMNSNGSAGTINFRIVDNGTPTNVLFDVVITNGQNVNTVDIPDPLFKNFRGRLRCQAKSTTASDDPIFDRIILYGLKPNRN